MVRALRLSSTAAEREVGISSAQLLVLQRLREASPRSVGELSRCTLTDPSSVSVVVSRLLARGLVTREAAADDVRRVAIALTRKGAALVRRAPRVAQDDLFGAFARLPAPTRAALADGLAALVAEMQVEGSPPLFFEDDVAPEPPATPAAPAASTQRAPTPRVASARTAARGDRAS